MVNVFFFIMYVFNVFCSFLFWFIVFFFGQHINSLIMYDLISRIPYTLLGQRIIVTKNDRALLINERFCFSSNSKFDSP